MSEERKTKNLSWSNPSFGKDAKEWEPQGYQYAGMRMPVMSEVDVQKQLTRERRERMEKNYQIAEQTLFKIYERNRAVADGLIDVQKAEIVNEHDINELVRKILKER